MKGLVRQTLHLMLTAGLSVTLALALSENLWARLRRDEVKPPIEPSFVTGYIVVLIMVALGLAVICRPSFRGDSGEDNG